jgi:hypothetical protein
MEKRAMTYAARVAAKSGRQPWRRWLLRGGVALLLLVAFYVATLLHPEMFFSRAYNGASIQVRSDEPIPENAAEVIAVAESRIRHSPLFDRARTYPVFVCNARWRWNYFSAGSMTVPAGSRPRSDEPPSFGGRVGRKNISSVPMGGTDLVRSMPTSRTRSRT